MNCQKNNNKPTWPRVKQQVSNEFTFSTKDSFLRALREVAPEMELFLENHLQHMKNIVMKLICT